MGARLPKKMCWVQAYGPSGKETVEVFTYGRTRRSDAGVVGHDVRVRPTRLGKGSYTMVVNPDALEPCADSRRRRR